MKASRHILIGMVVLALVTETAPAEARTGRNAVRRALVTAARFLKPKPRPPNSDRKGVFAFSWVARKMRATRRAVSKTVPLMPPPEIPLLPEASIHVDNVPARERVILNSVPTEGHESVVLTGHGLLDTTSIYHGYVDAHRYGGAKPLGITRPGSKRFQQAGGRLWSKDGWVVVSEDLGSDVIPFENWRYLALPKANIAAIRKQLWEVYQRLPFFSSKVVLEQIPGSRSEYRVRFQDAVGWHPNPQMSLSLNRAEFDQYLTEHVGIGAPPSIPPPRPIVRKPPAAPAQKPAAIPNQSRMTWGRSNRATPSVVPR